MKGAKVFAWATVYVGIFTVASSLFALASATAGRTMEGFAGRLAQVSLWLGMAAGVALGIALVALLAGGTLEAVLNEDPSEPP